MKLRGGMHTCTTGRWCGLSGEEQICKNCDEGEVADVGHFLLHCSWIAEERG